MNKALDPFIQVLKPDLAFGLDAAGALHDQDSSLSSIFVIFICSLWADG